MIFIHHLWISFIISKIEINNMKSYILLDINGTVGTDFPDILEKLKNPDNFIWVEKVQAHIKLLTLKRLKNISEKYNTTILWASLRGKDSLCLNKLIDVNWGWIDISDTINRYNTRSKTAPIAKFAKEHTNDIIIFCDDMLINNDAYSKLKSEAPNVKLIIPSTTIGLNDKQLDEIEEILKNQY